MGALDPTQISPGCDLFVRDWAGQTLSSARLSQWDDASGGAHHLTQSTAGNQPRVPAGSTIPIFQPADPGFMNIPSGVGCNTQSCSVFAIIEPRETRTAQMLIAFGTSATLGLYLNPSATNTNTVYVYAASGGAIDTGLRYPVSRCLVGLVADADGVTVYVGDKSARLPALSAATTTGGYLGQFITAAPLSFNGGILAVIKYNVPLAPSAVQRLKAYCAEQWGDGVVAPKGLIVLEGDSIQDGYKTTFNRTPAHQLERLLPFPVKIFSYAVPGESLASMAADEATQVFPTFDTSYEYGTTYILEGGLNDITTGASAATIESLIQTRCVNARVAGARWIGVCTITPILTFTGGQTTIYNAVNAWIRANYLTFADYLIDFASDAQLGTITSGYFDADQVHPNNLGTGVQAQKYALAVAAGNATLGKISQNARAGALLASTQGLYAPAKAGDPMALVDGAITALKIATDAITAAKLAADVTTEVQTGLATATSLAAALTAINNLNNLSALANLLGSPVLEIPDTGTTQYQFLFTVRDAEGHLVAPDSTPTVAAVNAAGTDRSGNLSAVSLVSAGVYSFTYGTVAGATSESIRITASTTVGASARRADAIVAVADFDSVTAIAAIKQKTDNLPADTNALLTTTGVKLAAGAIVAGTVGAGALNGKGDWLLASGYTVPPTASQNGAAAAAATLVTPSQKIATNNQNQVAIELQNTNVDGFWSASNEATGMSYAQLLASTYNATGSLSTDLTALALKFTGITSIANWYRARTRKSAPDATALEEINTGGGTFDPATDSEEAIAEAVAGEGSGGGGLSTDQAEKLDRLVVTPAGGVTLSSYPPSLQSSVPQPGVGAFAPGGRIETGATALRLTHYAGSTLVLLARVVDADGAYLVQANAASISSTATNQQDATDTSTAAHVVADSVFDDLQADARWTEDGLGYNLAIAINGPRLSRAGTTYAVATTITDADGHPIIIRYEVQTL